MGKKKPTIGYWYKFLLHFGWCLGPIDALLEIRGGDRSAWKGVQNSSGRINIDAPTLWGGEKSEGGIVGDFDVMMGEPTQAPNDYLGAELGDHQPGYRGKATGVFRGGKVGAMNPYPKPWGFKLRRILKGWRDDDAWYPEKAPIAVDTGPATDIPGTFFVPAGTSVTNGATNYGLFVPPDFYGTADEIAQICLETRNTHDSASWTFGSSFYVEVSGHHAIGACSAELGNGVGMSGVEVIRVCALGYLPSVEGESAALGLASAEVVCIPPALLAMNPAHILYESLTNPIWGQGEPTGQINEASFTAAADQLFDEGFGLCTIYDESDGTIEDFQQRIINVIAGSLSQSRFDGQFYLDLIRDNYVFDDLPIITEQDVLSFEQEPSNATETINQILVDWFDQDKRLNRTTAPIQSLGAIQTAGAVISETHTYREIPSETLALRVGKRDLNARSKPTSRFKLTTNRIPYKLRPAQPFRLQMPSEGIGDMVCRVGDIDYGLLTDGKIAIVAAQDVYGMPDTVYVAPQPGLNTPSDATPAAPPQQESFEVPYVELAGNLSHADLTALPDTAGYLGTVASRPGGLSLNYSIYSAADGEAYVDRGSGDWCPTALIVEAANTPGSKIYTDFTLSAGKDLGEVELGTAALWGEEIVRVDALDLDAGTITLARGCADTTPSLHDAGERIWFYDQDIGSDNREYVDGELVHAKLLTRTPSQELALGLATDFPVSMNARAVRPYPPARFKINDLDYPASLSGEITLSFGHRDRILQADQIIDTSDADIGPEAGTTYNARWYLDAVLVRNETGITGETDVYTPTASGTVVVEVESERDGFVSWQMQTHTFDYAADGYLLLEGGSGNLLLEGGGRLKLE